jgi:hypothetical protein
MSPCARFEDLVAVAGPSATVPDVPWATHLPANVVLRRECLPPRQTKLGNSNKERKQAGGKKPEK